jgi:pimeloyl-ACP methyl ester carboxylesterase
MSPKLSYSAGLSQNGLPYVKVGDRQEPLVVFTSGSPDTSVPRGMALRMFVDGAKTFAKQYTVYFVKRKQGLSPGYTTKDMADDYAEMIQRKPGMPCHILGISAGGFIAEHFAAKYPELVRKLVIAIAGYQLRGDGRERVLAWRRYTEQRELSKLFVSMYTSATNSRVTHLAASLLAPVMGRLLLRQRQDMSDFVILLDALLAHNGWAQLERIQCPVLILGGAEDVFYPPAMLQEMGEQIPHAQVVIYQGVGHGLVEFRKQDFERDVLTFLRE